MITGMMSCNVYVDDFAAAEKFYGDTLGLRHGKSMGEASRFFRVGDNAYGLYLEGGCVPNRVDPETVRASFSLRVDSAHMLFARLREAGVELIDDAPCDIGNGYYWFRFRDPAGNIIEAISGAD